MKTWMTGELKMVNIDIDDFQLHLYENPKRGSGNWTARLVLQGKKVDEILKNNTFQDLNKDLKRQFYLKFKSD